MQPQHTMSLPVRSGSRSTTTTSVQSAPAYQAYSQTKPFLNSDHHIDPLQTVDSFPEGSRDAVLQALKSLQDKIRQLELERAHAEKNLRSMNRDTSNFQNGIPVTYTSSDFMSQRSSDIKRKLDAAEGKCGVLERQLDYMRNMVHEAEVDRRGAVEASARIQKARAHSEELELREQVDKLKSLERDNRRLAATQDLAQNKIRELERQLKTEQVARRHVQQKAAEIERDVAISKILEQPNKTTVKKAKKKRPKSASNVYDSDHYRLNLGDVPFIAGKSVERSHALGANFQEVVSLMKTHNKQLCRSPRAHAHSGLRTTKQPSTSSAASYDDLDDVLQQLQDEFARLSFSHQELNQQILDCNEPRLRVDLERELEILLEKMEAKGDQIARIKDHLIKGYKLKAGKKAAKPVRKAASARVRTTRTTMPCSTDGQIQVTTTIKAQRKPSAAAAAQIVAKGNSRAEASKHLLQDLRKIQATLKKDDIVWEY